ncbi:MAG TPA: type VI secretion system tip protein TssI/VgrG, partial [Burkholderiales bacterium]|nr:type VI secretion system tip protein TssI/VgrG [Burkholderiales bacterium]
RETDFNFVSRLMEQEGIYYYFKHEDGRHTMVVCDSYSAHSAFEGYAQIPFIPQDRMTRPEQERISEWNFTREIQPGRYVIDDYDFERPSVELQVKTKIKREHPHGDYEVFDYPGEYNQSAEGDHYVQTRIEELHAQFELANGTTNARGVNVGSLVKLAGHPRADQNREYLVVSSSQQLQFSEYESMEGQGTSFDCSFTVLNSRQPFRSARTTPKPMVQGPQTAVVVGPGGDEIYTDKYGRVKVQFHWDRLGEKNENSSCWIRVSHPWAGKNWGMVAIPRIGQEVIVDFLEGDPDQPIITGRVYNAEQMPPYALPANMTQTGMLSRSSKGGSGANANELRFEDKKGAEQVFLHAEKNQDIEVENDETHWVGHDRKKTIDNDETVLVKHDRTETVNHDEKITVDNDQTILVKRDRSLTVDRDKFEKVGRNKKVEVIKDHEESINGSMSVSVNKNLTEVVAINYSETVGAAMELTVGGAMSVSVGGALAESVGGAKAETIGASKSESVGASKSVDIGASLSETIGDAMEVTIAKDLTEKVGGKSRMEVAKECSVQAKKIAITADDEIVIKTGSAEIVMKKNGDITIKGGKINIKGSSDVIIKGSKIQEN